MLVGAGLSLLGIAAQAMVRNPLADPYILGISSGESVGPSAVIALGVFSSLGVFGLSLGAFISALAAAGLVYALAHEANGISPTRALSLSASCFPLGFKASPA